MSGYAFRRVHWQLITNLYVPSRSAGSATLAVGSEEFSILLFTGLPRALHRRFRAVGRQRTPEGLRLRPTKGCWTAARRHRHGLQSVLCVFAPEEIDHLLVSCSFSRVVWGKALGIIGLSDLLATDCNSFWVVVAACVLGREWQRS